MSFSLSDNVAISVCSSSVSRCSIGGLESPERPETEPALPEGAAISDDGLVVLVLEGVGLFGDGWVEIVTVLGTLPSVPTRVFEAEPRMSVDGESGDEGMTVMFGMESVGRGPSLWVSSDVGRDEALDHIRSAMVAAVTVVEQVLQ